MSVRRLGFNQAVGGRKRWLDGSVYCCVSRCRATAWRVAKLKQSAAGGASASLQCQRQAA